MSPNEIVPAGQYTAVIYNHIKDYRYPEAIQLLTSELGVSKMIYEQDL